MPSREKIAPSHLGNNGTSLLISLREFGWIDFNGLRVSIFIGVLLYGLLLCGAVLVGCLFETSSLPPAQGSASPLGDAEHTSNVIAFRSDQGSQVIPLLPRLRPLAKLKDNEDYDWLELDGRRTDLILIGHEPVWTTLRRICGATGREIWRRRFPSFVEPSGAGDAKVALWKCRPPKQSSTQRSLRPKLVRPAPDLDGDGTGDLVWYSREHQSCFLIAISGASGKLLWLSSESTGNKSRITSPPLIADVNHDGLSDVIVCVDQQKGPPWIEAISGKDGRRQWRQYLVDLSGPMVNAAVKRPRRLSPRLVALVNHRERNVIAVEGESRIQFHAIESGLPAFDTLSPPGVRSQSTCFADFDLDGESEVILVRKHDTLELVAGFPPFTISAWQAGDGRQLWRRQLSCALAADRPEHPTIPLTDLDNDRRAELAISNYVRSRLSIDLVDPMTCRSRWPRQHRLTRNPEASVGQILECPDLDGDSMDDLLVVTLDQLKRTQSRLAIFLDLLSGRNGESIATLCRPLSGLAGKKLVSASWIPQGNRFPLLALVTSRTTHRGAEVFENGMSIDVWSLPSRQLVCAITDVDRFQLCDFAGTGHTSISVSRRGFNSPAISVFDFHLSASGTAGSSGEPPDDWLLRSSYLTNAECKVLDADSDPRWMEPLPWSRILDRANSEFTTSAADSPTERIEYVSLALLAFLGIFVAPGWLVLHLLADRQWSLSRWLLLPAVAGVAITSSSMFAAHQQTQEIALLSGLPLMLVTLLVPSMSWTLFLLPIEIVALLLRRHYATVIVLLSIAMLLGVVVSASWLLPIWSRMDHDSRFDWDQWHWIWLATAYLTGWGYLLAVAILHVAGRKDRSRFVCDGVPPLRRFHELTATIRRLTPPV